jgi:3-deoxy-manno-octulosonate cytidylyltransferase (CMP-KDO synthetase)
MSIKIAIPARFESTRLPGKLLLDLLGKPVLAHVIERAQAFPGAEVVVATDDERIGSLAKQMGVRTCYTSKDHPTGSDRLAECATQMQWSDDTIVVNLQGDEPLMPLSCLQAVAAALEQHSSYAMATLATPIADIKEVFDPHNVKVVCNDVGRALYFSRAPIPWPRDEFAIQRDVLPTQHIFRRHLGLYAYRAGALRALARLPQSALEKLESLEQLRALEASMKILVLDAPEAILPGIDTLADLRRVAQHLLQLGGTNTAETAIAPALALHDLPQKIAFVCMGNICRSPLSAAYARKLASTLSFTEIEIQSRGTHAYHKGAGADVRSKAIARSENLDLSSHRAQLLTAEDFLEFDLVIGHDDRNMSDMRAQCPTGLAHKLIKLTAFSSELNGADIPDPYLGDHHDFIRAMSMTKTSVDGLFQSLKQANRRYLRT